MSGENTATAETQEAATSASLSTNQQQKQAANRIQKMLDEENGFLVLRLTQMFGVALVEAKAQEAVTSWQQAHDTGASAYVAQPNGTRVAKSDGTPRSKGGVFFQVMREHCQSIGLNWYGVFPYQSRGRPGSSRATTQGRTHRHAPYRPHRSPPRRRQTQERDTAARQHRRIRHPPQSLLAQYSSRIVRPHLPKPQQVQRTQQSRSHHGAR